MSKHLTPKQKANYLDLIIARDTEFCCWYCKKEFLSLSDYLYDHLNNNRQDNRIDNLVLACRTCNNKKPHSIEMKVIAIDKLDENEISNYMREKMGSSNTKKEYTEFIISNTNYTLTKMWLIKHVDSDPLGYVEYSEALDCISYDCREKTGHGSQQSVRQYINTLTSMAAPFEIVKNDKGKKIIRRKKIEIPNP